MRIECTKEEKFYIERSMIQSDRCPFPHDIKCVGIERNFPFSDCRRCIERRVEWKVMNDEEATYV